MQKTAAASIGAEAKPGRYIPVRKRALLDAITAHPGLAPGEGGKLADLARRIALIFHVEFFAKRDQLKDAYVRFSPEQPGRGAVPADGQARDAFFADLHGVLMAANFRELAPDELDGAARDSAGRVRAKVKVPEQVFDEVRFYVRGRHTRRIRVRKLFGLRKTRADAALFDDVVFAAALNPDLPKRALRATRLRPGAVYLKLFRDIPIADLRSLYPNARVVMGLQDQLILGVPAVVGGVPILINIIPALSVLLVVLGAYLGISGTVEEDAVKQALAALSGLGALAGFMMRQWVKYERQKLKYQKQVSDNAYFNMVNTNAGFFDALIGASEDSEVKEACLAYAFLRLAEGPLSEAELDARIERWLAETFRINVDFEIDDALRKLRRLELIDEDARGLRAVPLDDALARAEAAWSALARTAFAAPG